MNLQYHPAADAFPMMDKARILAAANLKRSEAMQGVPYAPSGKNHD